MRGNPRNKQDVTLSTLGLYNCPAIAGLVPVPSPTSSSAQFGTRVTFKGAGGYGTGTGRGTLGSCTAIGIPDAAVALNEFVHVYM